MVVMTVVVVVVVIVIVQVFVVVIMVVIQSNPLNFINLMYEKYMPLTSLFNKLFGQISS